jgi:predicted neuraminidase
MLLSLDRGLTWTNPHDLFTEKGSFDRNRIIYSLKGNWIFPIYYAVEGDVNEYSAMKISSDQQSWVQYNITHSNYLIQPSVVRPVLGHPSLTAYLRDRRAQNIYSSVSMDDGYTWSKPAPTQFPNNNAAIQACVLNNGHILLVYNPTTKARVPLRVSLSEDRGATWPYSRDLETSNDTSLEYSYPSLLQTPDDFIHVTYTYDRLTIKYVKFLENWIRGG